MEAQYQLLAWLLARLAHEQAEALAAKDGLIRTLEGVNGRLEAMVRQAVADARKDFDGLTKVIDRQRAVIATMDESAGHMRESIRLRDEYMASRGVLPAFAREAAG